MNRKNLLISGIVVFLVYQLVDFVTHQVILGSLYQATAELWRPDAEMMSKIWVIYVVGLLWAFIFVCIFGRLSKGGGIVEGLKYGFCIGLFVVTPMAYGTYAVMPIPYQLALGWFVLGMVKVVLCGAVLSLVYKPSQSSA